jgi:hypothetical protein
MTATQQALLYTKMDAVHYILSTGQCQWSKKHKEFKAMLYGASMTEILFL